MYQESALQSYEGYKKEDARFAHVLDFSNLTLPEQDQFSAFRAASEGVMDLSVEPDGPQSFPVRQTVWILNRLVFVRTKLPGIERAHRRRHLKKCRLDHWYISLPYRSPKVGDRLEPEGSLPELHCLATPFDSEIDHDGILTLFIPQDLFASTAGLDRMLDRRFEGGLGKFLADHMFLLERSLVDLRLAEVPYIVEATRSLVGGCLARSPDRLVEVQTPIAATLLARARRLIDERLTDCHLSSDMLCVELGVSRSRLYRMFEPLGGVVSYIRKRRLLRTREALSDIADTRSISRIAEQWGFIDASTYSRAFRHEFHISPKQARDVGWASGGLAVTREHLDGFQHPQTLGQVLHMLSA
jgi:AraC-like DNA-binding protein